MKTEKREAQSAAAERLKPQLSPTLRRSIQVAKEKGGASSWLIALPIKKLGFSLHKSAFRDALCSRYGWQPSIRHNEICDLTATPMSEICHDVCTESPPPPLQPLSGESLSFSTANREDSARLDVRARGFGGLPQQDAYFDVSVFNPNSPSYRGLELTTCYRRQEREKQRAYEQRVREVEHGSFTPLEWTTSSVPALTHRKLVYWTYRKFL